MEKVGNMQKTDVDNVREMEVQRKNKKEILEIQNTVMEIFKNAFGELISSLALAEERISELENMTIETSIIKKQREKKKIDENRISKICGTTKVVTYT